MHLGSCQRALSLGDDSPRELVYTLPEAVPPYAREDPQGSLVWTAEGRTLIAQLAGGYRLVEQEDPSDYTWAKPSATAHLELGEGKSLSTWVDEQNALGRTVLLGRGFPQQERRFPGDLGFTAWVVVFAFDQDPAVIASESLGVAGVPYPVYAEPGLADRLLVGDRQSLFWVLILAAGVGFGIARVFR
jgi:hypothetical protein